MNFPLQRDGAGTTEGAGHPGAQDLLAALAIVLAGLASGESRLSGALDGDDAERAAAAMSAFGARFSRTDLGWIVSGAGNGCLLEAAAPLEFGDAAAAAALVAGVAATYDMRTIFARPPLEPAGRRALLDGLREMGVQIEEGGDLVVHGPRVAAPVERDCSGASPAAGAALLLAGLNAPGTTGVIVPGNAGAGILALLQAFGVEAASAAAAGGTRITVTGQTDLAGAAIDLTRPAT